MINRSAICSCGQLCAQVVGRPLRVSVCHCLACQRRSGSVFAVQARYLTQNVVLFGTSNEFVRRGDDGGAARFRFCPSCGSTICYTLDDEPGVVAVPVGAFADPLFPAPEVSYYENRRHPWVLLPAGMECTE